MASPQGAPVPWRRPARQLSCLARAVNHGHSPLPSRRDSLRSSAAMLAGAFLGLHLLDGSDPRRWDQEWERIEPQWTHH